MGGIERGEWNEHFIYLFFFRRTQDCYDDEKASRRNIKKKYLTSTSESEVVKSA